MADVQDVAAYIVARFGRIDTFKLQKLLYYSQAWHLVWDGEPLFEDEIEAWAAGPVVRSVYVGHRGCYQVDSWRGGTRRRSRGASEPRSTRSVMHTGSSRVVNSAG